MEYLQLKKTNCRNCHKCIRNCPVKSIRFSGNQAYINENECILCGNCFVVCPQGAKQIVSSIDRVKELLRGNAPVYVSLAPSAIANYEGVGIEAMREALIKLGFAGVEETAIGATIVKREYDRMLAEGTQDVIISSCCHSVNLMIQKYFPSLVNCLADVLSPMLAHGQDIRRRVPDAKVVFIGPCVSKKDEADRYPGYIDAVLTFDELSAMLKEASITPECRIEPCDESLTRFFPTPGGVLKTMEKPNDSYAYMAVDGAQNCINVLNDLKEGGIHHCFIEMNMCVNACVGGPIMEKHRHATVRSYQAVANYAGKRDFAVAQPEMADIRKTFPVIPRKSMIPDEKQITSALRAMGKYSPKDELNCGTCGYNTCREKAIAICQGKAEVTMCLPYLMARADNFSETIIRTIPNGLIVVGDDLSVQQANQHALEILGAESMPKLMGEFIGDFMDPADIIETLNDGKQRCRTIFIENSGRYAEETVVYDRDYQQLVCILRDVTYETEERERRDRRSQQTIDVADKVISHQMRVVQEIASLLGETAAETKTALTKLKESIENE